MPVVDALMAFRVLIGENDAMAYLVNMAPRLVELRRVLKRTGSMYLHCDPTMSHYLPGVSLQDVWTDIDPINSQAAERLGYPTQKPLRLLERIIRMSSDKDGLVLDPFCGCGTAVDAAQRLGRRWIGIDITFIAVDLIEKRLHHVYGAGIAKTYEVFGIPRDMGGARSLFRYSPFDFERWAVSLVNAQPNEKQVGDKGIDGVARFSSPALMR